MSPMSWADIRSLSNALHYSKRKDLKSLTLQNSNTPRIYIPDHKRRWRPQGLHRPLSPFPHMMLQQLRNFQLQIAYLLGWECLLPADSALMLLLAVAYSLLPPLSFQSTVRRLTS